MDTWSIVSINSICYEIYFLLPIWYCSFGVTAGAGLFKKKKESEKKIVFSISEGKKKKWGTKTVSTCACQTLFFCFCSMKNIVQKNKFKEWKERIEQSVPIRPFLQIEVFFFFLNQYSYQFSYCIWDLIYPAAILRNGFCFVFQWSWLHQSEAAQFQSNCGQLFV